MVFYAWFIVAKEYIREKASLHTGFFGRDHRLKRETDFFSYCHVFKNARKSSTESKLYTVTTAKRVNCMAPVLTYVRAIYSLLPLKLCLHRKHDRVVVPS